MVAWRDPAGRLDADLLALVAVTDGLGDADRIEQLVTAALAAGVRCFYLREPSWSARTLFDVCARLRPGVDAARGVLLVGDRLDVVAAGAAHGAWLGRRSLPVERARAVIGAEPVLAFSAHDPVQLRAAAAAGCDFASLSPVWATSCKPGATALGAAVATKWTEAAALPVIWLGGIGLGQAAAIDHVAAGIAVRSAWTEAANPRQAMLDLARARSGC